MPAAAVASRTPAMAGMAGTVFGARGDTGVDTVKLIRVVMAGLAPAIHVFEPLCCRDVDARHKAGHDASKTRHFFAGAAGLSAEGSGAGAGLSRRSIWADLRRLSTSSAWARWAT